MSFDLDSRIDFYLNHLRVERQLAKNSVDAYSHDLRSFAQYAEKRKTGRPQRSGRI